MFKYLPITDIYAREVLDSRGNPTVEVDVLAGDKYLGRASVPAGASTGKFEAAELRDGERRYRGLGVRNAVAHVNDRIAREILGMNALNQLQIDEMLMKLDGTENKINLGANALLAVSMAVARAAAKAQKIPLYKHLGGINAKRLPVPMMNILNGGKHADNGVDIQEFMIIPCGAESFAEGLEMGSEIYYMLRKLLGRNGYSTAVGDEGGFAPNLPNGEEALRFIAEAIEVTGYKLGEEVCIALDVAASELYDKEKKKYNFSGESRRSGDKIQRNTEEMIEYYEELLQEFPIVSIEDPLDEEDWAGWEKLTRKIGDRVQLVGDDLFVTNTKRLSAGIGKEIANAVLVKMNQIGTLTETMNTIQMAQSNGYSAVISHRSGETEDSFIADLAVAFNAGQIKTGAPCRGERTAKYNQLLRIEEMLGGIAEYSNPFVKFCK